VGLGKDDGGLDIFDTPPRTDILMERIIQATQSRQGKQHDSLLWSAKKVKERRQSVIKIEHWTAWMKVDSPESDGMNNTEPAVTLVSDKLDRPKKSKGLAIPSERTSPCLHSASNPISEQWKA
jgi:hypothetical protein